MKHYKSLAIGAVVALSSFAFAWENNSATSAKTANATAGDFDMQVDQNAARLLAEGRKIFRYDTFGNEIFWGNAVHLHQAIAGAKNGGVGPGISPKTALSLGLKVDVTALPRAVVQALKAGRVDLDDPATTLTS